MDQSLFRSILATLDEHIKYTQNVPRSQVPSRPLFDLRSSYRPALVNLHDVTSRFSSLPLPAALFDELNSVLESDLNQDRLYLEQAYQRLLDQLSTVSSSNEPSTVASLLRTALDAFYARALNSRMDTLQEAISSFSMQDDSASESGESDESLEGMPIFVNDA